MRIAVGVFIAYSQIAHDWCKTPQPARLLLKRHIGLTSSNHRQTGGCHPQGSHGALWYRTCLHSHRCRERRCLSPRFGRSVCRHRYHTHATYVGSGTFAVHGSVEWTVLRWIQLIQRTFYESARACTFLLSAERVDAQHAWARADVLTLLASNQFRRRASVAGSTTVATQPEYAGTALRAKRDADSTATHGSG